MSVAAFKKHVRVRGDFERWWSQPKKIVIHLTFLPLEASIVLYAAVQGSPMDTEQLSRLAKISAGDIQRRFDVTSFEFLERFVETEALLGLQVLAGRIHRRPEIGHLGHAGLWCSLRIIPVELGKQLLAVHGLPGVLAGEPDHDIAQFPHVTGETILHPEAHRFAVKLERIGPALTHVYGPVMLK